MDDPVEDPLVPLPFQFYMDEDLVLAAQEVVIQEQEPELVEELAVMAAAKPPPPLNPLQPLPLAVQAQMAALRQLQAVAARMESDYVDHWLEETLDDEMRNVEQKLDVISQDYDINGTITAFECQLRPPKDAKSRRSERLKATNPYVLPLKKREMSEEALLGVYKEKYVEYRKCKYLASIERLRTFVQRQLSPGAAEELMATLVNLACYNDKQEHGILTAQATLVNDKSKCLRLSSPNFHLNFAQEPFSRASCPLQDPIARYRLRSRGEAVETRIGTSILHYALVSGPNLTHLHLGRCCCDSILKTVSEHTPNLLYLNVNGSAVTDKGMFYLSGAACAGRRQLPRRCKRNKNGNNVQQFREDSKTAFDDKPPMKVARGKRYLVTAGHKRIHFLGCDQLRHFECKNLSSIRWPHCLKYYLCRKVPKDAGLVAMLAYLPSLQVISSEVGQPLN